MFGNAETAKVGLRVAREGKGTHKSFKCISTKLGLIENTQKICQSLAKYIFLYIFYFYNFNRSKNTHELSCKYGREAWGSWNRTNTTKLFFFCTVLLCSCLEGLILGPQPMC